MGRKFFENSALNFNKRTRPYWLGLIIISATLAIAELVIKASGICFEGFPFLQNFFIPFRASIRDNFFDLLISQISTTFLVTSFLSFLSGNDTPIYWTTAMQHKLITPKGTSIRDIAWYCIGTLIISLVTMFFDVAFAFLFSFVTNIVGLTIITARMILAFFAKDQIKYELLEEFKSYSYGVQQDKITNMEEHAVVAAQNHDIGYLRDNLEFLRLTKSPHANRALVRFCELVPRDFFDLFADAVLVYCEKNNMLYVRNVYYNVETVEQGFCAEIEARKIVPPLESHKEFSVFQNNESMRRCIRKFLHEDIAGDLLIPEKRASLLRMFDALTILQIKTHRLCRADDEVLYANSDLPYYFKDYVYLIKAAFDAQRNLTPYISSLKAMQSAIIGGFRKANELGFDTPKTLAFENDKPCLYSWNSTQILYRCVPSQNSFHEDPALYDFLKDVYNYTEPLTETQWHKLRSTIDDAYMLSEDEKRLLIKIMTE